MSAVLRPSTKESLGCRVVLSGPDNPEGDVTKSLRNRRDVKRHNARMARDLRLRGPRWRAHFCRENGKRRHMQRATRSFLRFRTKNEGRLILRRHERDVARSRFGTE